MAQSSILASHAQPAGRASVPQSNAAPSMRVSAPHLTNLGRQSAPLALSNSRMCSLGMQRPNPAPLRAIAENTDTEEVTRQEAEPQEWFAVVANAEFMFNDVQNESFAEQLREKKRFYGEQGMEVDFFLVSEPAWLEEKFPEEAKKVKRPCVALVSPDKQFIVFMKLRLDRVMRLDLGQLPQSEVLKSNGPVPKMQKPDKWTAPYSPYADGWWEVFMPKA